MVNAKVRIQSHMLDLAISLTFDNRSTMSVAEVIMFVTDMLSLRYMSPISMSPSRSVITEILNPLL